MFEHDCPSLTDFEVRRADLNMLTHPGGLKNRHENLHPKAPAPTIKIDSGTSEALLLLRRDAAEGRTSSAIVESSDEDNSLRSSAGKEAW